MMKKKIIGLLLILIGFGFSCNQNKEKVKLIDENTFEVGSDNEKIKLAIKEAQKSLDFFISEFTEHSKDTNYWFIAKTKFESNNYVEHMWITTIEYNQNSFKGILIDEPYWAKQVKLGDTIEVLRENIEDWSITNEVKDIHQGSFTEKYLFDQ